MKRIRLTIAIASTLMSVGLIGCGRPPLRVSEQGQTVIIDMQSLGEYPSNVARLRLVEAKRNRVVWEIKGRGEPQLGRLRVNAGPNPVQANDVRHGIYDVVVPSGSETFTLQPGERYVVEVWGNDAKPRTKRQAEFIVPRA